MGCDKIQEQLSDYLDNTLSPAEKGSIDKHLRSCPKCRKALADLEITVSSVRGLEEIIPPPWLTQKIMTRIITEEQSKKKSLLQRLFYPLHIKLPIEAVGIFLIAITALYVFKTMEPELKNVVAPSEETVPQYAPKGKVRKPGSKVEKHSQPPAVTLPRKGEEASRTPSIQESGQLPASQSEQLLYDKEPPVKETSTKAQEVPAKEMLQKSAPSPAGPLELKQERSPQAAGKIISGFSEKEDISLSFKTSDIESTKRELEEVLSDLGGKLVREEPTSDTLIIIGELGSDKLLPLMQRLKILGYVKEKTPTPMSDKDRVLIKITLSGP